jgi:hypothetical protein
MLQSIAAFPSRDDATSPVVYLSYLVLVGLVLVTGLRAADRRLRLGVAAVAVASLALPVLMTVPTYDTMGTAWQGRYTLPLAVGLPVLLCFALDRRGRALPGPWPTLGGVLFVVSQVVSAAYTLHVVVRRSPLVDSTLWWQPAMWLVVALAVVGSALMWWGDALLGRRSLARPSAR